MKIVALMVLLAAFMACCFSQPLGAAAGTQPAAQQQPNLLQLLLMQNMFDSQWLPLMYMSGGGGSRSIFPWLLWGNM